MIRKNQSNSRKKTLLITAIIVLLIAAGTAAYFYTRPSASSETATENTPGTQKIDLSPATESDREESNQHKEDIIKQEQQTQTPSTGKKSVTPLIVDAGQYNQQIEVRSFVSGVVESTGSCTMTFTNGNAKVTKTVSAVADATTTRCTNLTVNQSEFSAKGTWSVVVSYSSPSAQGNSQPKSFEVK